MFALFVQHEEVERLYACLAPACGKAYGSEYTAFLVSFWARVRCGEEGRTKEGGTRFVSSEIRDFVRLTFASDFFCVGVL